MAWRNGGCSLGGREREIMATQSSWQGRGGGGEVQGAEENKLCWVFLCCPPPAIPAVPEAATGVSLKMGKQKLIPGVIQSTRANSAPEKHSPPKRCSSRAGSVLPIETDAYPGLSAPRWVFPWPRSTASLEEAPSCGRPNPGTSLLFLKPSMEKSFSGRRAQRLPKAAQGASGPPGPAFHHPMLSRSFQTPVLGGGGFRALLSGLLQSQQLLQPARPENSPLSLPPFEASGRKGSFGSLQKLHPVWPPFHLSILQLGTNRDLTGSGEAAPKATSSSPPDEPFLHLRLVAVGS